MDAPLPFALMLLVALVSATKAGAQTDVDLEVGASRVGPPSGLDAAAARFAVGGVRLSHVGESGSGVSTSVLFGTALDGATGGDFASAGMAGVLEGRLATRWRGAFDVEARAFTIQAPFPYRALTTEARPSLRFRSATVGWAVTGIAGVGGSRVELKRPNGPVVRVVETDLWRVGGESELRFGPEGSWFAFGGGVHRTSAGTYGSGGARVLLGGTWGALELRLDRWRTPQGWQTTGGLSAALDLGRAWGLRGFGGRSSPDPLTLAQAGSGSVGMLLTRSLIHRPLGGEREGQSLHRVLSQAGRTARVRIETTAPAGAGDVAVAGDFTHWDAVPMRRDGDTWVLELEIEPGTYHYGFLVDDDWYLPDDATDVVPDEWGRSNAVLVIEGDGS